MNQRTHLWAGVSGSVGDFSEHRFFGVSLVYSVAVATGAGIIMIRALRWAESSAGVGRSDSWGAIGVYDLALTAIPAIMYGLLLADESKSLRDRELLVYGLWLGGNVVAVSIALLAGRALLGGRRLRAWGSGNIATRRSGTRCRAPSLLSTRTTRREQRLSSAMPDHSAPPTALHRRRGVMCRLDGSATARVGVVSLVLCSLLAACGGSPSAESVDAEARFGREVELPAPELDGPVPLNRAIDERRSVREFTADPLPIDLIGQLLWAGQGVTSSDGKRASPSAGATYPLELYVVTADSVMHYLPEDHRVEHRDSPDLRIQLQEAAFDQAHVGSAPAVIVIAAVFQRTAEKYGDRARDYVNQESGHTAQNILLEATGYGLTAVPTGGFDSAQTAKLLDLPADLEPLYLIPTGFPSG